MFSVQSRIELLLSEIKPFVESVVMSREKYVNVSLMVYVPDPVTDLGQDVGWNSKTCLLEASRQQVWSKVIERKDEKYYLSGRWVCIVNSDIEEPDLDQPLETTNQFDYSVRNYQFLSANAYYWIEEYATYLKKLMPNLSLRRITCDPQSRNGERDAKYYAGEKQIRLGYRMNGSFVPAAADMSVLVHEYIHAVCDFLSNHRGNSGYEHAFCDALAVIYRHRFDSTGQYSAKVFPFYNNQFDAQRHETGVRTLDRAEQFDSPNFESWSDEVKQSMLATAFWEAYTSLGGRSSKPCERYFAGDMVTRILINALAKKKQSGSVNLIEAKKMAGAVLDVARQFGEENTFSVAFQRQGLRPSESTLLDKLTFALAGLREKFRMRLR